MKTNIGWRKPTNYVTHIQYFVSAQILVKNSVVDNEFVSHRQRDTIITIYGYTNTDIYILLAIKY